MERTVDKLRLNDLAEGLEAKAPQPVLRMLAQRGVEQRLDLLAGQARGWFDDLPEGDGALVEEMIAHAALGTIGVAAGPRATLLAGYRPPNAPTDIAATPRDEFVRLNGQ